MKTIAFSFLFCAVALASYIGFSIVVRDVRASVAERKGESFVQKLYAEYSIVGQSCQGEDTDNDTYVSCDFRLVSPQKEERVVHLQCPTVWKSLLGNSCKESRLIIPQQ
ncbi:hypothetical protein EBR66_04105 [bacterium]|nr:hypothetical protein [bacterium]